MGPEIVAVSASGDRGIQKTTRSAVEVVVGRGVTNDVHAGSHVRHLARMRADPTKPNLRQVHLLQQELHRELASLGLVVRAGEMGENLLTRNLDLLDLPRGTLLRIGETAVLEITGLRNPCKALDEIHEGLMDATLEREEDGSLTRKAGVMSIVVASGQIQPGDRITVELPAGEHEALQPV